MRLILTRNTHAFTLIEFTMTIALFAILTVASIQVLTQETDEVRFQITTRRMLQIRQALVGDPEVLRGAKRSEFGYLGDVGGIPTPLQGLSALFINPGLPAAGWSINPSVRIGLGWSGPYLKSGDSGQDFTRDGWGTPFIYNPLAIPPTLISRGADRAAGGTGFQRDITLQLPANVLSATVHGFITQNATQWSGNAEVEINYPNGSGALTQSTATLVPGDKGHFSFSNIPLGVRSATVYIPSKASATRTIGPAIFTCDRPYCIIPTNFFDLTGVTAGPTDLEVPIEMVDYGLSSAIVGLFTTFERTRTPLNTADYDGTVSYAFEVVATNTGLLSQLVSLIDSSGATVVMTSIPPNTNVPTRIRIPFTPVAGANNYRIQFPITLVLNQLTMTAARIIVNQVGATKTNVYVPLLSDGTATYTTSDLVAVDSTNSTSFIQGSVNDYSIWKKDSSKLSLASGSPYTLSVSISGGALGGTATAALFNRTTGTAVTGASVSTNSALFNMQSVSFSDTAANFTDLNEFELRIKSSSVLQSASIARAGLWIKLSNLGQGEVYYRVAKNYSSATSTVLNGQRVLIDGSKFSHPSYFAEAIANSAAGATTTLSLFDAGTSDNGVTGSTVSTSTLTWGTARNRQRSPALSLIDGHRYLQNISTTPTLTSNVTSSFVVIQFQH